MATRESFMFASRPRLTGIFFSGGRNRNEDIFVQISGLGGYHASTTGMRIRAKINGTTVGSFYFNRWTDHSKIVFDHRVLYFSSNVLNSGRNEIVIEPDFSGSSDYCWIGPVIVHFRQNS